MKRTKPASTGEKGMRTRRVSLRFTDDKNATGSVIRADEMKNCDCSGGVVSTIPEWEKVLDAAGRSLNANIDNLLEVSCVRLQAGGGYKDVCYLLTKSGSVLYYREDLKAFYVLAANKGDAHVFPIRGKGGATLAICSKTGFFLAETDGTAYKTVLSKDTIGVGAFFKHRIFVGGKGGLVRYSAPEDFENFTLSDDGGGEFVLPNCGGELIAMKPYQDALYLFFESGIVRLEVGGEASGFYVEQLDYTGGDIFPRTICVCQHAVYFLARGGLHRLNGKKTERLDLDVEFPSEITGEEGCAVWKDRPMFRFKSGDSFQTVVITKNGKSAYFMNDLNILGGDNGEVLFINNKKEVCRLTEKGTDCFSGIFRTQATDFGWSGKKRLESLRFYGEGEFDFTIWWENGILSKKLVFEDGVVEWNSERPERGEWFAMSFELGRESKIRHVVAEYKTWG